MVWGIRSCCHGRLARACNTPANVLCERQKGVRQALAKLMKSEAQWRTQLTAEQYYISRQNGTERPFTTPCWNCNEEGLYGCVRCGQGLFRSEAKFDPGAGWPCFHSPVHGTALVTCKDRSQFRVRTEISCTNCDAHLGHLFDERSPPGGLRYSQNGTALVLGKD